jgi:hypothetical protein
MEKAKNTAELLLMLALGATVVCLVIDSINRF